MTVNFELRRPKHAIGEFAGSVTLFQPVSPTTFGKVTLELEKLAEEMRLPRQIQSLPAHVTSEAPFLGAPLQAAISGYQRYSEDGEVAISLICDPQSITLSRRDYSRWHKVKPEMLTALSRLIEVYIREVPAISSIKVQYLHEFLANSDGVTTAAEIFRGDSRWLAPFHQEQAGSWHCHTGVYLPEEGDRRQLVNINCDVTDVQSHPQEPSRLYVKALIMAGCFYNITGKRPLNVNSMTLPSSLEENFEASHVLEKSVLEQLVSDEYLAQMGVFDD